MDQIIYPEGICGAGLCHLRALVNVWGQEMVSAILKKEKSLPKQNLDPTVVKTNFEEHNNKKDHLIYFIYGIHWVALTPEKYPDDAKHFSVTDFNKCKESLLNMSEAYG